MSDLTGDETARPVDPRSGKPIEPRMQPGYYPGFRTLEQRHFWDAATREVVLDRVYTIPPIRFFTADEAALLSAVCDRLLPQEDRDDEHRVPIVPQIDKKLFEDQGEGYRFEDMPSDREAFRLGLRGIERIAQEQHGCAFVELSTCKQEAILKGLHDNTPLGAHEVWQQMPAHRFFMELMQNCVEVYYAHPFAWDEIGFGGPAYPRAYMRLERGEEEPWEVKEVRYDWAPPASAGSAAYEPVGGEWEHLRSPGRGGTH